MHTYIHVQLHFEGTCVYVDLNVVYIYIYQVHRRYYTAICQKNSILIYLYQGNYNNN